MGDRSSLDHQVATGEGDCRVRRWWRGFLELGPLYAVGACVVVILCFGFVGVFVALTEPNEPTSDAPCASAVAISADTFELYEELVKASSGMAVEAIEWDVDGLSKSSQAVAELSPELEESFAEYERHAEECRGVK